MANITVRNDERKAVPTQGTWEPFGIMRQLMSWDPFQEMLPLLRRERAEFAPDFEIKETKETYVFRGDVPGVKSQDLDVTVSGNRLTVAGKRESEREEKTDTYYACERSYGSFSRSFTLPEGADAGSVAADLKDGVLTLTVKKLPEQQAKKIAIKSQSSSH